QSAAVSCVAISFWKRSKAHPINKKGTPTRVPFSVNSFCSQRLVTKLDFRDRLKLHIARTFVNLTDLSVAPELLDRVLASEAVTAVKIDGHRADLFSRARS